MDDAHANAHASAASATAHAASAAADLTHQIHSVVYDSLGHVHTQLSLATALDVWPAVILFLASCVGMGLSAYFLMLLSDLKCVIISSKVLPPCRFHMVACN